jgi:hypothetical protein
MSFWKRLRVYIIGFGLGLLLTYMFFGDRACGGWLPGNRVRSEMTEYTFLSNDYLTCQMEQSGITTDSLAKFILNSSVSFPPVKEGNIRIYSLISDVSKIEFSLNKTDSTFYIYKLPKEIPMSCDTLNKKKMDIVELPFKKVLKEAK